MKKVPGPSKNWVSSKLLAPTYPESMMTRPFPFNAYYDEDEVREVDAAAFRLEVSGLVADKHAWTLDEDASRTILRQAVDAGITFFDTANAYSFGSSEEIVGRAARLPQDLPARPTLRVQFAAPAVFAGSFGYFIGPRAPVHLPGIAFLIAAALLAAAVVVAWRYARVPAAAIPAVSDPTP